jgi:hypothetical protein
MLVVLRCKAHEDRRTGCACKHSHLCSCLQVSDLQDMQDLACSMELLLRPIGNGPVHVRFGVLVACSSGSCARKDPQACWEGVQMFRICKIGLQQGNDHDLLI